MDEARRDDLVQLCQGLVRYPSPSGEEGEIAAFLRSVMVSLGYDSVQVDGYGSLIGTVDFGSSGPTLLLEAQMDHAESGDPGEWRHYPFGGWVESGRIYGRGATDQKGILAAMVLALAWLKQDRRESLCGRAVMAAMVHQESFERAASKLVADRVSPDGVVSGEPSDLTVERGQRGRASIAVETFGRMEHSSMGDNSSADMMVRLVSRLKEDYVPKVDPFFGEATMTLTSLHSYPVDVRTTMPIRCRATFDRRILPGETAESVMRAIDASISSAMRDIPSLKARAFLDGGDGHCYTGAMISSEGFATAWEIDVEHPFVGLVLNGVAEAGLEPVLSNRSGFGTNGCIYGGDMSVPTVVFGPSRRELAHVVDEYIEVDQLALGCKCYGSIAEKFLARKEEIPGGEGSKA
jgi:putative selenium metabolism hydrolase